MSMSRPAPMKAELDHVFILCDADAPEAAALSRMGLVEGSGNTHPGQGTACRRFFFRNAYLELAWVHSESEARSQLAGPVRLWERWSRRRQGGCPFGIALRPSADGGAADPPFAAWAYEPPYLPSGLTIHVARDTPLTEPALFFMAFQGGRARAGQEPVTHAIPAREITGVRIGCPPPGAGSEAARSVERTGVLSFTTSRDYVLELTFDLGAAGETADLRPDLPLVMRW